MIILVDNRSGEDLPEHIYKDLAEFVLTQECASEDAELSISLVGIEEMQVLNRAYRGLDCPTDVLSFENDGDLLGDVIICPGIAREHAEEFSSGFESEMALMLTHGILHLMGYDHDEDTDAEKMEARENDLLRAWKHVRTNSSEQGSRNEQ